MEIRFIGLFKNHETVKILLYLQLVEKDASLLFFILDDELKLLIVPLNQLLINPENYFFRTV